MTKQIVVIHGGDCFANYEDYLEVLAKRPVDLKSFLPQADWKANLAGVLGKDWQVLLPRMPNKQNARYQEWVIWFERMAPFLEDGVILIGHSLGAIFLPKYLSEHRFAKKIAKLILVAAPYSQTEYLGDFVVTGSLAQVSVQCAEIVLFYSHDDPVVPLTEAEAYVQAWPQADLQILENRQHFNQAEFPELIEVLRKE